MALTDRERDLLAFEARFTAHDAKKEEAVRGELQLTPARYYQLLDRLIVRQDALAADPLLVGRLLRMRDAGAARRARLVRGSASS